LGGGGARKLLKIVLARIWNRRLREQGGKDIRTLSVARRQISVLGN